MAPGPFAKFRVIDLTTDIAGPYATKLLADYGADVVKVEPAPAGDPSRSHGPFFQNDPHPEKSLTFLYLNCNKRGVTLNLEVAAGRKLLRDLVKGADALLENFPPGYLAGLGLGYAALEKVNPRLVMTSITPFGQTGPYRDFKGNDLVYYAFGGQMYISGAYDREPLKHGHPQSYYLGGMVVAHTTAAALFARRTLGEGQYIDLSLAEVMAADQYQSVVRYAFSGQVTRRSPKGDTGDPKGTGFNGIVPAKDGYMRVTVSPPGRLYPRSAGTPWRDYVTHLGHPELAEALEKATTIAEVDAVLLPMAREMPMHDYFHRLMTHEWDAAIAQSPKDLVNDPHLAERGYYTEVEHPVIGKIKFPGEIVKFPKSPWSLRFPAPLLGQHNRAVYCGELGYSAEDLVLLRQTGAV